MLIRHVAFYLKGGGGQPYPSILLTNFFNTLNLDEGEAHGDTVIAWDLKNGSICLCKFSLSISLCKVMYMYFL